MNRKLPFPAPEGWVAEYEPQSMTWLFKNEKHGVRVRLPDTKQFTELELDSFLYAWLQLKGLE